MKKNTIIEAQNSETTFENGSNSGILGKLKGVFADYIHGTRNGGRVYAEELWDNRVLNSEDVQEALRTKTLFGELDHPEGDRCETLAKNACISITKLEKRPEEGVIYGEAEILDTPTGRIVKALADSGAKLGVSSRGMGEEVMIDGKNMIDPDTYDFITFDVVVTPANEKARVELTESKHINKIVESFSKEIDECENENQLNQMKTTLESVKIDSGLLSKVEEKLSNINKNNTSKLSESNKKIALSILSEKYSGITEDLNKVKQENTNLLETINILKEQNSFLTESRRMLKQKLKSKIGEVKNQESENEELTKVQESLYSEKVDLVNKNKEIILKMKQVNEKKIENLQKEYEEQIKKLNETYEKSKKQFNNLVSENNKLSEHSDELKKYNDEILTKLSLAESESREKDSKIKMLENKINNNAKKLQESKLQESKVVKDLESKVQNLLEENKKLQERQEKFSELSFNPVGTFRAFTENMSTNNKFSNDDLDLLNALTNK